MLSAAEEAESRTRNPPLRWGFFIAQATLLALVCGAQMLPAGPSRAVTVVGLLAIVGIGMRWVFVRPGYGMVAPDMWGASGYLAVMLVGVGVPALLALEFGLSWMWLVAGAVAAGATLEMGRRYRRAVGRG